MLRRMWIFLRWFGRYSKGVTAVLAIAVTTIGGYQYFEAKVDRKITRAIEVLERREKGAFLDARTTIYRKWLENERLFKNVPEDARKANVYTEEILKLAAREIIPDIEYRIAMLNISTYYTNAAACALDGLCDLPMMCASLMGEIQHYLEINSGYFTYAEGIITEDALTLKLSMPEFVAACDEDVWTNLFSRHDRSYWCAINLKSERIIGLHVPKACGPD